jgi:hypothetical protein
MKTSQIMNSARLIRAAIETTEGVPAAFTNQPYLSMSDTSETSDNPITIDPIAASPTERAFVSYQTDSGRGATAKGFLFSALTFIGKQIATRTASNFITAPSPETFTLVSGQTITLAGVTATATTSVTSSMWSFIANFAAYVNDGTATSANFTYTGTLDPNFDFFYEDPAGLPAYMSFIAKDPLYTGTVPTKGGTMVSVVWDEVISTGSGTQINLPELYPIFVAAGLAPTVIMSLGLPDNIDALNDLGLAFKAAEDTHRLDALSFCANIKNLIAGLRKLPIGTAGLAALTTLYDDILDVELKEALSYNSSSIIAENITAAKTLFASNIALGHLNAATEIVKIYFGEIADIKDAAGVVEIFKELPNGKSVTINGRTYTNTTGSTVSAATVANAFRTNTGLTGTITLGYSFGTRTDAEKILLLFGGGASSWKATVSSTATAFKYRISPPFENVYESSIIRSSISSDIGALSNSNPVVKASFDFLKAELNKVWAKLNTTLTLQDGLYTAAAIPGAFLDQMAVVSGDTTFVPSKLTYVYSSLLLSDSGIATLDRISIELTAFNERGTTKKVTTIENAVVTSLDLSLKANQPPELNFTFAGNPGTVEVADGNVVGFTSARLATMPQMSGENVTYLSFVAEADPFVHGNILLQEFSLPNLAGIKADRTVLATEAYHKISTDTVGRKATLTIIDGDTSDTEGGLPLDYKALLNKPVKFILICGNIQGLTYIIRVNGVLTNESPGSSQTNNSERMLEVTVRSCSITLR